LQDDGWWLRRDNVWAKRNPMPESCKDRCTSSHEYLFHLTKSPRYFYDAEAIKEPQSIGTLTRFGPGKAPRLTDHKSTIAAREVRAKADFKNATPAGILPDRKRNKRSVWTLATAPFPEAHFATFPPALVEPCILAGTSARGVCPRCAAPWARVVERNAPSYWQQRKEHDFSGRKAENAPNDNFKSISKGRPDNSGVGYSDSRTIGWHPTCKCGPGYVDPIPATVLDPFLGAGTTGLVAARLGRDWVGIELSPAYAEMARRRLGLAPPLQKAA
jgi:DNA modification methylase